MIALDPNDAMVLTAAINGRANAIVTFKARNYGNVPQTFGIDVLTFSYRSFSCASAEGEAARQARTRAEARMAKSIMEPVPFDIFVTPTSCDASVSL